jgi:hemoglobin
VKATGGPDAYTGRDMRTSHAGLRISEQEWAWSVEHLTAALDVFKVPAAEKAELLAAVGPLKADIVDQNTLYTRLGGHKAIEAVCDEFLARFGADPRFAKNEALAARLKAIDMDTLRYHLIAFVAKATGGPSAYTGRDMKSSHVGLNISEEEWTWSAEHLTAALDKFKVPAQEKAELLGLVGTLKKDIVANGGTPAAK